jgi:hypothetical protein
MVKLLNRAKMSVSGTPSTGNITLNAAITNYQTFAQAGAVDTDVIRYAVEDGANWEVGSAVLSSSATVMTRTVEESSNSNNPVDLTSSAIVFATVSAADFEANPAPRWTTEPASTLGLANDGSTAVTLTGVAVDENFPVRYSWDGYSGSTIYDADSLPPQLASAPVINQTTGVTSLVGSSTTSNAGTYYHRSRATDGINTLWSTTAISLVFFLQNSHTINAPIPQSSGVYFGWGVFVGDTYYGASAPFLDNGSSADVGGVFAFNLSDNSALTGFNPLYIPSSAANDDAGKAMAASHGKEMVVTSYERGVGVAYLYTLPSTSATQLTPNGWSGTGSTTFTVAKETGTGSHTHTYKWFGYKAAMSPNGNYVAISSYYAAQVQIFAGKDFGAYSKGDHIQTIQLTNNQYALTASQYGINQLACNDTHVMTGQAGYHGDSNESDVGRVRLYEMATGTEVTAGPWPYMGAAGAWAGGSGFSISNAYATIDYRNGNNPAYLLVDLSDNSYVTRSFTGSAALDARANAQIYKDTHVITGQPYTTTNGTHSGTIRAWRISDGTEDTSGVFPLHGAAADRLGVSMHVSADRVVAGAYGSLNGASVTNQGHFRLFS